jgi:xanthine dehydrogenase large subunit
MDVSAKSVHAERAVGKPLPHDSAHLHVTGRAAYTDDLPEPRGLLHVAAGMSGEAHAFVENINFDAVRAAQGVRGLITAADIPGENNFGPIVHDDPILAGQEVLYVGHPLFAVAAESVGEARKAARLAEVKYKKLDAIVDAATAVEKD